MTYTTLLILHFLGLALGVGTSFAMLALGRAASVMSPPERGAFMGKVAVLSKNGAIGLTLLLVSGFGMMFSRGTANTMEAGGGAFHGKLALVLVMCGLFGWLQVLGARARRNPGGPETQLMPKLGAGMLLLGVSVITLATIAFH